MPVEKPFGCPHCWSCCLALVRSPCGLVVASYRSNFFPEAATEPTTFGGATVLAIAPARSRLSTSFGFTLKVRTILLGSCLALGSVAGFQCGFGTIVSCLLIW